MRKKWITVLQLPKFRLSLAQIKDAKWFCIPPPLVWILQLHWGGSSARRQHSEMTLDLLPRSVHLSFYYEVSTTNTTEYFRGRIRSQMHIKAGFCLLLWILSLKYLIIKTENGSPGSSIKVLLVVGDGSPIYAFRWQREVLQQYGQEEGKPPPFRVI